MHFILIWNLLMKWNKKSYEIPFKMFWNQINPNTDLNDIVYEKPYRCKGIANAMIYNITHMNSQ